MLTLRMRSARRHPDARRGELGVHQPFVLHRQCTAYKFVGAALAERGFVTVLPDCRLYPKVRFPEFLDDAR